MIKGMTGFGSAQFSVETIKGVVEIKSLNHRYFDISYYLPMGFSSAEDKIRQMLQKEVERGRVTVAVKITQKPTQTVWFNKILVKQYLKYAHDLQKDLKLKSDLSLGDLIKLPGVVEVKETILDPETLWPGIEKGMRKAIDEFTKMRGREGRSLAADVSGQLKRMSLRLKQIQARAKIILRKQKKEFTDEEFASFQKSNDINEELSRLSHYIEEVKVLLKNGGSVGKNIDFIAQEMQRETNTIGSKVQDKLISNAVIALKGKIEKIREQSQNVE